MVNIFITYSSVTHQNDQTLLTAYLHAALASPKFTTAEKAMLTQALAYFSL